MEELMKYTGIDFEQGLNKEWIITNGIGGFAYCPNWHRLSEGLLP